MKVKYKYEEPFLDDYLEYAFEGGKIGVRMSLRGVEGGSVFDFSDTSNGKMVTAEIIDDRPVSTLIMDIPSNPFISVERVNGELYVHLVKWAEPTEYRESDWFTPDDKEIPDELPPAEFGWKSENEILEEAKENKKIELSSLCQDDILSGFNAPIENKEYHFSYDMEAQTNMQETYQMFQNNVINEINWSARSNEEKIRVTLNKREFEKVYYEGIKHKQALISKLKDKLEPLVDSTKSEEELDSIHWDTKDVDSVKLNTGGTMDKNIQNLEISQETSDTALMEFVNMVMMGMM